MKNKQRIFIYDSRERAVLIFLVATVALFCFTLGIHLGKRVGPKLANSEGPEISTLATLVDQLPNRQELTEQAKGQNSAVEEVLTEELHHQVSQAEVRLDTARQVDLPAHPKNSNAGATTPAAQRKPEVVHPAAHPKHAPESSSKASGHSEHGSTASHSEHGSQFTLQIGSYATLEEAKRHLASLNQPTLKPFLREAEIKGKGKWFRVYSGEYATRDAAETAGKHFRSQKMISSFVVSKISH